MPDSSVPENTPAPKRLAGRKRGRRGTAGTAFTARTPASRPVAPAAESARAQVPNDTERPPSPVEVPASAVEVSEAAEVVVVAAAPAGDDSFPAGVAHEVAEPEPPAPEPPPEPAVPEPSPPEPERPPVPERGLATILGGAPVAGRPTWLDVPPERIGSLLAVFADEGARLLAMTVLPAPEAVDAPLTLVDLRYHFVVNATPITVSTRTPRRNAPSAAGPFPAMTWRERELAGEYGLRFVEPLMGVAETPDEGSGVRDQGSVADDKATDLLLSQSLTPDP